MRANPFPQQEQEADAKLEAAKPDAAKPDRTTQAAPQSPSQGSIPISIQATMAVAMMEGLPSQLPPFGIPAALERCNGKAKLLRKMILGFRDRYTDAVPVLRKHIAVGEAEDAERLAHSLKGVAATLEANGLALASSAVEQAFRSEKTENLEELILALENELGPAIAAANSLEISSIAKATVAEEPISGWHTPKVTPRITSPASSMMGLAAAGALPRVLIVDDEPLNIELLTEALGDSYEVVSGK